ncbi:MAG: HK97 family phage prohead protease [Rhodospirillaceae bacterium]|nr:HK97 family phage prohead protease [Rhodospirillaceae bacterium]
MSAIERRYVELRAAAEGRRLEGVAVRYGDTARLPWGRERVAVGAFRPLGDVLLNASHDRAAPLARTGGAGLVLLDTADQLAFRADLPVTRAADDVLELVRAGVMRGASVEMRVSAERIERGVRVIERAVLSAIGIVDSPAYPASEVEARRAAWPVPAKRRRVWL